MRKTLILIAGLALMVAGGCGRHEPRTMTAERLHRGLVIVLPGIEGVSPFNKAIVRGLVAGGVDCAIELHDWTTDVPGNYLYHLRAEDRNRGEASKIATRIRRYQAARPGKPVVLVGQSGGGAIAAWVAELMGTDVQIDGVIMLSPSLSPRYGLSLALHRTKRGIINFYSPKDWVFLGVATTIAGTMDGNHMSSAGRVGFKVDPPPWTPEEYKKLHQIRWNRDMARSGNRGGHLTSGAERFVADYVAPLVRTPVWNQDVILNLLTGEDLPGGVLDVPGAATTRPATAPATQPGGAAAPGPAPPASPASPAGPSRPVVPPPPASPAPPTGPLVPVVPQTKPEHTPPSAAPAAGGEAGGSSLVPGLKPMRDPGR